MDPNLSFSLKIEQLLRPVFPQSKLIRDLKPTPALTVNSYAVHIALSSDNKQAQQHLRQTLFAYGARYMAIRAASRMGFRPEGSGVLPFTLGANGLRAGSISSSRSNEIYQCIRQYIFLIGM